VNATNEHILIIGLTGSIGMGKSTVAKHLSSLGLPVCDADAVVHKLYAGAAVAPIESTFPGVTKSGVIDRAALSARLMQDPKGFKRLEAIVHPLVQAAERGFLQSAATRGDKIAVLEIPLLFETCGDKKVDITLVVTTTPEIQRSRVLARPGMTEDKLAGILARQLSDTEKRKRADYCVDTSGTVPETHARVSKIIHELHGKTGTAFARHWA
jgi:dephospho-CoA kinase